MTIIRMQQRPRFANLLDNFIEREFSTGFEPNCGCLPATNILENNEKFEIQMAVPGLSKEDFKMEVDNNILSISFERKAEEENREDGLAANYLRREYHLENFTRSFTIPKHTFAEKISARYDNGMLYISIPREDPEKVKLSKRIEIQ